MTGSAKCVLNFRKTPEKADNIIEVLQKNKTMQIKEDNGEWLKVAIGKKTGYVMAKYVAIHPEAPEPSNPRTPRTPGQGNPGNTTIPDQLKIEKDKAAGEIDEDGNFLIDGKIVGKVDGDNILITDPDIIAETLAEIEKEDGKDE